MVIRLSDCWSQLRAVHGHPS